MNDFDQKRAADHLDLYRSDGRYYDLSEENGVLLLQLRRSVIWDRCAIGSLAFSLLAIAFFFVPALIFDILPGMVRRFSWTDFICFILVIQSLYSPCSRWLKHNLAGEVWVFDRNNGRIEWKTALGTELYEPRRTNWKTTDGPYLSEVLSVRAWQRRAKFHLEIKMRSGLSIHLGRRGFCRSEHAWRHDAAHIAAFLGVPLDIPPVIPE